MINSSLETLNPEQLEIVNSLSGSMLVIAGAGSGKTRVIVYRMINLINNGVEPKSILLLTFTKKAAEEMMSRVSSITGGGNAGIFGGTFHHFCNKILRRYYLEAGLDLNFTIMDSQDSRDLVGECRKKVMEKDRMMFDLPKSSAILKVISMAENHVMEIYEAIREFFPLYIHHSEAIEAIRDLYIIKKRENNCVDFDDLLSLTLKLLKNNENIYQEVSSMFKHIMVDEFQDTNKVQAELALLLARPHGNIMVVGDDMQSIYSFRGAHYKNIINFPNLVSNTKVYTLNSNYRSTPEILSFANALIDSMDSSFPKDLISHRESGELPEVVHVPDDVQQAVYVADEIMNDINNGISPKKIAVMYRAHSHSLRLQTELIRNDIPFTLRSGLKFFELAHIKDLIAFMKSVINPNDALAIGRLLKHIPGIGKKTVEKLMVVFSDKNYEEGMLKKVRLKKEARQLVLSLFQILKSSTPDDNPIESQREFLNNFYNERIPFIYDNPEERIQDIEAFMDISSEFDSIVDLVDDLSLMGENHNNKLNNNETMEDGVILTSIHQSKGLEWDIVYIIHCQDGAFPNNRCIDDREKLQEEYRLFYVAVTRARKKLVMVYPALITGYKSFYSRISRFIGDIPDEFYDGKSIRLDYTQMNY